MVFFYIFCILWLPASFTPKPVSNNRAIKPPPKMKEGLRDRGISLHYFNKEMLAK
jgi:hypothetical protein